MLLGYDEASVHTANGMKHIQDGVDIVRDNERLMKKPDEDDIQKIKAIQNTDVPHWYPKDRLCYPDGTDFKEGTHIEGINSIESLFTRRNLIALSILYHQIELVDDGIVKDLLKFRFTSMTHLASKMTPVRPTRPFSSFLADASILGSINFHGIKCLDAFSKCC